MSVSGITDSLSSINSSAVKSKADESLQQLADEGDPMAIAELKAQQAEESPAQPQQPVGPAEPGKGENVDTYI